MAAGGVAGAALSELDEARVEVEEAREKVRPGREEEDMSESRDWRETERWRARASDAFLV